MPKVTVRKETNGDFNPHGPSSKALHSSGGTKRSNGKLSMHYDLGGDFCISKENTHSLSTVSGRRHLLWWVARTKQ